MRPLLFAPETLNFSETQRMLDIARECRERFDPLPGPYEYVGPVIARLDGPIRPEVENLPRGPATWDQKSTTMPNE